VAIPFLPWQRWLLIHALELLPDGRFRYRTVLVLVSRQNGKTKVVEIKNLFKMFALGVPLVLGTAQDLDTAEETWESALEIVQQTEELAAELDDVKLVNGKKSFTLASGSRWKVRAATRRGGRGLSGDDVNLDELREHLTWESWGAVTKTTTARPAAQIWGFSNAGDNRSVVLNDLQAKGRAAARKPETASPGTGLFEWSADDDIRCDCERQPGELHGPDCRMRDPEAWAQANPALGYTISVETLEGFLDSDPDETFLTEHLCIRVPDLGGRAIDVGQWAKLLDQDSHRVGDIALAVDISPKRDHAAIGVFGPRADGLGHTQLADYRPGTGWTVARLAELKRELDPIAIAMGAGTYNSLKTELAEAGMTVPEDPHKPKRGDLIVLSAADMSAATGQLLDAVQQSTIRHIGQPPLDASVSGAKTREVGDTVAWSRKNAEADTCPLVVVTEAQWAYKTRAPLLVEEDYDVLDSIG
jgi:phage terminase large subunit-like protein